MFSTLYKSSKSVNLKLQNVLNRISGLYFSQIFIRPISSKPSKKFSGLTYCKYSSRRTADIGFCKPTNNGCVFPFNDRKRNSGPSLLPAMAKLIVLDVIIVRQIV